MEKSGSRSISIKARFKLRQEVNGSPPHRVKLSDMGFTP